MALLARTTPDEVEQLAESLGPGLRAAGCLEAASQWFVRELIARFPSIVLVRVFGTVPLTRLPLPERDAAEAAAEGLALLPATEVLTLFASAGVLPDWNERRRSRGHLAIPLVSRAHVDEIPMVSRLLSDLRFRLEDDPPPSPFVTRAFANANGSFFVPDAARTRDAKDRMVIPAAGFVRDHGIRSVFGFGGSYVMHSMFVSTIVFTQEHIAKQTAIDFVQLSSAFKAGTSRFINRGLLFEGEASKRSNG